MVRIFYPKMDIQEIKILSLKNIPQLDQKFATAKERNLAIICHELIEVNGNLMEMLSTLLMERKVEGDGKDQEIMIHNYLVGASIIRGIGLLEKEDFDSDSMYTKIKLNSSMEFGKLRDALEISRLDRSKLN